jgi:hypothetical protein
MLVKARSGEAMIQTTLIQPDIDPESIRRVFDYWKAETGHRRAVLDQCKTNLIIRMMRDGYDEEILILAIKGVKLDPWPERKNHNSLPDIFKRDVMMMDGEVKKGNVDRFVRWGDALAAKEKRAADDKAKAEADRVSKMAPEDVRDRVTRLHAAIGRVA